jgi:hypothetical protein
MTACCAAATTAAWCSSTACHKSGLQAGSQVLVTMPSGKKILLKPGQRYDLNESRIKDVNEP